MPLTMKKCNKCGLEKTEFHKNTSYCKECNIVRVKEWAILNKEKITKNSGIYIKAKHFLLKAILDDIKHENGCSFCGENDACCLDFHHIANKSDNVSKLQRDKNVKKICEELNKCIIVCANCHRKLHDGKINIGVRKLFDISLEEFITRVSNRAAEFLPDEKRVRKWLIAPKAVAAQAPVS